MDKPPRPALTQGNISKALKAARAAGLQVVGFDLDATGRLSVRTGNGAVVEMTPDPFEQWKESRDARQA